MEASLTAAKEGQEIDRQERWRRAAAERVAEEERLKKKDAAKAEAKAQAAEASAAGGRNETNQDPLSSFFTELEGQQEDKAPRPKVARVLHEKYTNQDLGTPEGQMARLLQNNYRWKNLNAFEALQLGPDATVEDVKHR